MPGSEWRSVGEFRGLVVDGNVVWCPEPVGLDATSPKHFWVCSFVVFQLYV